MKKKQQQQRLRLLFSSEPRSGGVTLYAALGNDWLWSCQARGNVRQWTPDKVEQFVRQRPEQMLPHGTTPPNLKDYLSIT